jgi:hypothetical protein
MPYASCEYCERVFITNSEEDSSGECPTCRRPLRPLTADEGRYFFLQLPVKRPSGATIADSASRTRGNGSARES